jgi:hypothetical protein
MATTYIAIASQNLASSASSVTFSSIPQTYTDLKLVYSARDASANGNLNLVVEINGSSGSTTNFSFTLLEYVGGPQSVFSANYPNFRMPPYASSNSTANIFGAGELYFPNYTTSTSKQIFGFGAQEDMSVNANTNVRIAAGLWRGSAAISSINVKAYGTFSANSRFDLYGITHI